MGRTPISNVSVRTVVARTPARMKECVKEVSSVKLIGIRLAKV